MGLNKFELNFLIMRVLGREIQVLVKWMWILQTIGIFTWKQGGNSVDLSRIVFWQKHSLRAFNSAKLKIIFEFCKFCDSVNLNQFIGLKVAYGTSVDD